MDRCEICGEEHPASFEGHPDPVDEVAADVDPRSPEAPEQIEELKDEAEALGREVTQP